MSGMKEQSMRHFSATRAKKSVGLLAVAVLVALVAMAVSGCGETESATAEPAQAFELKIAVEFTDHAACAMVAEEKGWFAEAGLAVTALENYVTGADLAAALARGDIQAAYICLVPAINARVNGGVDIKVVAGTHKYGYGLVVDAAKITKIEDLAGQGLKLGCTQAGTSVDVLLQRLCEVQGLPTQQIAEGAQRMNPPSQVLALQAGKIDACFVPEHWATMAATSGYKLLATAQDIWPDLQGSVLVVKSELLENHPDVVEKLVRVTDEANVWINDHPDEAAAILAESLTVSDQMVLPDKAVESAAKLQVTPEIVADSMTRLEYRSDIDAAHVQSIIDYMDSLGYLKKSIDASELLDLRFLQ